jgi:hypothetical protein
MSNTPWNEGYMAVMDCTFWNSAPIADNPYPEDSLEWHEWNRGCAAAWEDECPTTEEETDYEYPRI